MTVWFFMFLAVDSWTPSLAGPFSSRHVCNLSAHAARHCLAIPHGVCGRVTTPCWQVPVIDDVRKQP